MIAQRLKAVLDRSVFWGGAGSLALALLGTVWPV